MGVIYNYPLLPPLPPDLPPPPLPPDLPPPKPPELLDGLGEYDLEGELLLVEEGV